ncbi:MULTISPECIES: hypothetical protein [Sphingomonas]|uniref:hypothetical protein n=1 Tax=Sphingomonas TaxID=13687 RepID=UPI000DEF1459|nr:MULTISPECIES: hypothetical protein [Sphingomonas]
MRIVSFIALAAVTAPLAAAPPPVAPPPPAEPPIVTVTAAPDVDRQVKDFVGSLAPHPLEQVGVLAASFCPAVQGLAKEDAAAIAARLRTVASAVGVKVGVPSCRPNMLLIATPDKRAFVRLLAERQPDALGNLDPAPLRALLRTPGYATAWQLGGKVTDTGQALNDASDMTPMRLGASASRLGDRTRPVFDVAVLVVEQRGLAGLTRDQLADYAAMRFLTGADPARVQQGRTPTVLKVLDAPKDAVVPAGLTTWDFSYLRALYGAREFGTGPSQRGDIRRALKQQVERARRDK